MADIAQRLEDLRHALNALGDNGDANAISELEAQARSLLTDAKNTPYEAEAQLLFAELARMSSPTSPVTATIRGLLRRARIRIEIAGDDDDIDEAIDILAEALQLNPRDPDVQAMLEEAAQHNAQAGQRVSDLFARYGVERKPRPAAPPPNIQTQPVPAVRDDSQNEEAPPPNEPTPPNPRFATSAGYPPPERDLPRESGRRTPGQGPLFGGGDIDDSLSELTQAYYAGDYQLVVDLANRVLSQQPGNATALDYRQKAEDNLIRGVVPDHRIPFDARVAYNRANSLARAGNYDEAERLYREAIDNAQRSGIPSWKDAEQALLDIQDLALAREMIKEGDRQMETDNWGEALRRYEGALAVVANDPQAEERIERVRRIQGDAEGAQTQINMLGGSLSDQANQLQSILGILARLRQTLPNSQRLANLSETANNRLNRIKTQLNEQAQSALNRAASATSLEERLNLTTEAITLLELGTKLDPADTSLSEALLEARSNASDMQRARQVIERAANHIAQNYDNELLQARSMLGGLMVYAQDNRYRGVVNDLLSRYIERAQAALDDGDADEAQALLSTMQDEPFNVVGRRPEMRRLEAQLRTLRQRSRVRLMGVFGGMIVIILAVALFTRPTWEAVLFPSATPTPTDTGTPTYTPTASDTPTPSDTPTATFTPSDTPTASNTPTETFTPSNTPTATDTPTATATPRVLCQVFAPQTVNVRSEPTFDSALLAQLPQSTVINVLAQERSSLDGGQLWYQIEAQIGSTGAMTSGGWVRSDLVRPLGDACPNLP